MNLLALDTSTETLSVALAWRDGTGAHQRELTAAGGKAASSALIPAVLGLLDEAGLALASLDAIVFGSGPGSFTGLRTACAVAQGLGFGAGVPVLGVETLLVVAEQARHAQGPGRVLAVLDARMDEVYAAAYEHQGGAWRRRGPIALLRPEALVLPEGFVLAGNAFAACGDRLPASSPRIQALPTAAALLRLAPGLLAQGLAVPAEQALPLYVRDKVAQTTEERQARRLAPAGAP